ncbi:hypothetical protein Lal_00007252 [Lupinus albus]|uniref:Basic blue protein n=1 Tax=Lupinus albus TaxID=3870 RepID=A0A6A5MQ16_LUPAL|nr:putative cupredoxin [Lupinus albus]KAF1874638.1 hypothetical protein Lal_00007252 [Lupinus albus]
MAQGRGNSAVIALMLLLCMLVFHSDIAHATTFQVGDARGWDYGVSNWPSGKTFKAGDILEFSYNTAAHNLAVVDKSGYNSCNGSSGKVFTSGFEKLTLNKGYNYFISNIHDQCEAGMKMAVFAN